MKGMQPGRYFVPLPIVSCVKDFLGCAHFLDGGDGSEEGLEAVKEKGVDIVGVKAGERIPLTHDSFVVPFDTDHRVPSLGYVLWKARSKLLPEYVGLSAPEIGKLVKSGVIVTDKFEYPYLAYSGDTTMAGLLRCEDALKAEILILECTFLNDVTIERAESKMHIHIQQIVENQHLFPNKHIVLMHFSSKYCREQVEESVAKSGLSLEFLERLHLFTAGLGQQAIGAADCQW